MHDEKIRVLGREETEEVRKRKLSKERPIYWRGRRKVWQRVRKGMRWRGRLWWRGRRKLCSGGLASLVEREKESLVMGRKWSLVEEKKGNTIGKRASLVRGGVQSPETSIDEVEGFNSTKNPAGGKWPR